MDKRRNSRGNRTYATKNSATFIRTENRKSIRFQRKISTSNCQFPYVIWENDTMERCSADIKKTTFVFTLGYCSRWIVVVVDVEDFDFLCSRRRGQSNISGLYLQKRDEEQTHYLCFYFFGSQKKKYVRQRSVLMWRSKLKQIFDFKRKFRRHTKCIKNRLIDVPCECSTPIWLIPPSSNGRTVFISI